MVPKPNCRYADVMEQALDSGAIAGLSINGRTFFHDSSLESLGRHHRWTWHCRPCCPPNIARLVASLGSYIYGVADDDVAVHLYCRSQARLQLASGAKFTLSQDTDYPWSGDIKLSMDAEGPVRFALSLRIPSWTKGAHLAVNGEAIDLTLVNVDGDVRIARLAAR